MCRSAAVQNLEWKIYHQQYKEPSWVCEDMQRREISPAQIYMQSFVVKAMTF